MRKAMFHLWWMLAWIDGLLSVIATVTGEKLKVSGPSYFLSALGCLFIAGLFGGQIRVNWAGLFGLKVESVKAETEIS